MKALKHVKGHIYGFCHHCSSNKSIVVKLFYDQKVRKHPKQELGLAVCVYESYLGAWQFQNTL